mgnify:CR=1 FL=1
MVNGRNKYRIKDIFDLSAGGDVDKEHFSAYKTSEHRYPIYSNSLENHGLYGYTSNPKYSADSVTITGRGSVGHAEYREDEFDAIIRLLVLKPKSSNVCAQFVADYINNCVDFSLESTGVPQLTAPQIMNVELELPQYDEQKEVTTVLADVSSLINMLGKQISKKKAIKQGAMQELLTGKRRLPGFSGEWRYFNLMKNSKVKARIGWQGLKKSEYLDSGYALLVTGTDFDDGRVLWDRCHYVTRSRYEQDRNIQLQNNDILITKDGSLGKAALVQGLTKPATLNSGIFVIRPLQDAYDPVFVYQILSSFVFKNFLDRLSAGSTIIHLYQKDVGKFEFLLPPTIAEQKAIAEALSKMDSDIAALENKLTKYRQVKQGMMQQLLTGKIRLV